MSEELFEVREDGIYSRKGSKMIGRENLESIRRQIIEQRDEDLGRWRSKDYPDWTVKPMVQGYRVVNEKDSEAFRVSNPFLELIDSRAYHVCLEYDESRPKTKPWHNPKHLEIWALTIQGCPSEAYIYREPFHLDAGFRPVNHEARVRFAPTDPKIVDAHRIWPEERN